MWYRILRGFIGICIVAVALCIATILQTPPEIPGRLLAIIFLVVAFALAWIADERLRPQRRSHQ